MAALSVFAGLRSAQLLQADHGSLRRHVGRRYRRTLTQGRNTLVPGNKIYIRRTIRCNKLARHRNSVVKYAAGSNVENIAPSHVNSSSWTTRTVQGKYLIVIFLTRYYIHMLWLFCKGQVHVYTIWCIFSGSKSMWRYWKNFAKISQKISHKIMIWKWLDCVKCHIILSGHCPA